MRSREARNVFSRLAELSVHGANVPKGQIVLVQAEIGLEEQARATAEAAYNRGAKFVDVAYFDPYLKHVRIESADPDTLDFVPQWYGERVLEHAEQNGARIAPLQPVFTIPFAVVALGERPSPRQVAGVLLAIAGLGAIAARVPAPTPTPRN